MSLYIWNKLRCTSCCNLKPNIILIQNRFKPKKAKLNAPTNISRALEYFDAVYPPVYGKLWDPMKNALFQESKYAALVNNFYDNDEMLHKFEEICAYNVGQFYNTKRKNHLDENKSKLKSEPASNISNETIAQEEAPTIRPSLIELTDDEKAELAKDVGIDRYPEEYKERALAAKGKLHFDSSRIVKASQLNSDQLSATYDHVPATKLKGLENWVEESDILLNAKGSEKEIGVERVSEKEPLVWPEHLKLFSFVKGDVFSEFPLPKPSPNLDVLSHRLLDGASILPILALDLQFGDSVYDICSLDGLYTLAMVQTLLPDLIVCNGIFKKYTIKSKTEFERCIHEKLTSIRNRVTFSQNSIGNLEICDTFDKVLIDAPCLEDRDSLQDDEGILFKPSKIARRLKMPEVQATLIVSALKSVKPGGCVVYSTRTLSPLQNDGAVHLALTRVWRETKMNCTVVDMLLTARNLAFMFKMGYHLGLRYGQIVLPVPTNNYGPVYVAKIIRNA